ncbi:Mur-ligase-M domain-containing protein [Fusarium sp. LHS14.1]|nr:Mur-ligase-M domain-containing protein [Fusarium sp. LHS14.1]
MDDITASRGQSALRPVSETQRIDETSAGNIRDEKPAYTETESTPQGNGLGDAEEQYQDPGPAPDGGGIINSFGVFQPYYAQMLNRAPSDISWIGSFEVFFLFFVGTFTGRMTDAGYFRQLFALGFFLVILGCFATSFCKTYWQFFLAQGICMGLGNGFIFCPSMATISTYFEKRRAFAMGVAAAGSATGGLVYPSIMRQLLPSVGFPWAIRAIAFVQLGTLGVAACFLKSRVPPRRSGPLVEWSAFKELEYSFYVLGSFMAFWGVYFAFYYLAAYARDVLGVSFTKSLDVLLVLNGTGAIGRVIPNYLADGYGCLTVQIPLALVTGVMMYCWAAIKSTTGLFIWTAIYGIWTGGVQSMFPVGLSSMTSDPSRQGTRLGMAFTIVSFATLTGQPIAGAIIKAQGGHYVGAQAFAGSCLILGSCSFVIAKGIRAKKLEQGWKAKVDYKVNQAALYQNTSNPNQSAIDILNTRRRPKRPSARSDATVPVLGGIPSKDGNPELRGTPSIAGMKEWLHRIGHSTADMDRLNVIHVAGTKGKGSTCAFIESFLRAHGKRTGFPRKTGLYTSPHLMYPEERIRLDFQPIDRDRFARYFFEVWDSLTRNSGTLPRYLQLLALVSFHTFIREGVEAAIFETHHGGEYDATNVIEHPVVSVITTLGMDHLKQLGPTIESIAWHKSGIFKPGSAAITSPQEASAADVLRGRSSEKGVKLEFVELGSTLPEGAPQLRPGVQRINCSVALAAADQFLQENNTGPLSSSDKVQGIRQFSWPGRFQHMVEDKFNWFLDGAHNEMSVLKAAEWFIDNTQGQKSTPTRILIFGQVSNQRDGVAVLKSLANVLCRVQIHHVIFTLYDPRQGFDMESTPGQNEPPHCEATL